MPCSSRSRSSSLAAAAAARGQPLVTAVDSVTILVSRSRPVVAFYSGVLDFEKVARVRGRRGGLGAPRGRLRAADARRADAPGVRARSTSSSSSRPEGRAVPADSRSNDRWFQHVAIIVSDMAKAYARLREHRVRHASSGPQRLPDWNPNAGGIEAFYFKDPDGHALEILAFPPGKGDPRWQEKGRLFLGIDHTAIVVSDTESEPRASTATRSGCGSPAASENYGTEQEHLNNVFGARLRITALRAAPGPGIEFLEYLAPSDGRPRPPDLRSNDLVAWQTRAARARRRRGRKSPRFCSRRTLLARPRHPPVPGPRLLSRPPRRRPRRPRPPARRVGSALKV